MKTPKPESGKPRKSQQLVASGDTPKLGTKGRRGLKVKFNFENVAPNAKKLSPGSRQTILSEYFKSPDASPKEPPKTEPTQKMVNVPRLLSQLLRARVVLSRLPVVAPTKPHQAIVGNATTTTATASDQRDLRSGRAVQRYCHKCRALEVDRYMITKRKICRRCGTLLLFICVKCNSRHFIESRHMSKHVLKCDGRVADGDPLESVVLRFCNDCPFKTSYEYVMAKHVKNTGHRVTLGERTFEAEKMDVVDGTGRRDEQGKLVVIRSKHADLPEEGIRRYCRKCKTVMPGSRTVNEDKCETCKSQLLYECSKCKLKTNTYKSIYYHVRTKCYPMVFGCPKCHYTAPFRAHMYKHLEMHEKGGRGRRRFDNDMKKKIEI